MKHYDFSRVIAGILVLALAVGLVPVTALAAEEIEDFSVEEVSEPSPDSADPNLGVQRGVSSTTETAQPRTREELLALEGVTLTEDGELALVNTELVGKLTDEEWTILLGEGTASIYGAREADPYEDLREQFGLTNEQIQRGIDFHGGLLAMTEELSSLWRQREYLVFSDAQWADLTELVTAGYTSSQAIWGYGAKDVLGVDVEDMVTAKAAEMVAAHAQAENTQEEKTSEPVSEFDFLAGKLCLPVALVEERLEGTGPDEDAIWEAARQAVQDAYPPVEPAEEDAPALFATGREQYVPEEILGKPYTYDQQGNFDVNVNTGAYSYTETDLSIPGKNGLDLVLTRQYHSDQARATQAYGDYDQGSGNMWAFQVAYCAYKVDTTQNPHELDRALTDLGKYIFFGSSIPELSAVEGKFRLSEFQAAQARKEELRAQIEVNGLDYYRAQDLESGEIISVVFLPIIEEIGTAYAAHFNTYSLDDPYLVNEFGLGHGWMLGLSHVRWVGENFNSQGEVFRKPLLVTSDGRQYPLQKSIGCWGNYIEDPDTDELIFHGCDSSEYTGASYGLYHKDGQKEYFDKAGRNIAIVDRFGNVIKIEYDYEDVRHSQVSKIKITDTMENTVEYTKATENTEGHISGAGAYNGRWQLTLNGEVVRNYYTISEIRYPNIKDSGVEVTKLRAVGNEAGELTVYNSNISHNYFNCVLQPKSRKPKNRDSEFANDIKDVTVMLSQAKYPNGGSQTVQVTAENVESFFGGGYRHVPQCVMLKKLNSAKIFPEQVKYQIGDYDGLDGRQTFRSGKYTSQIQYRQSIPFLESDGTETGSTKTELTYSLKCRFFSDGRLLQEEKTSYTDIPSWQESFILGDTSKQASWMSRKTTYTYKGDAKKPSSVKTTYYDIDSSATMTQEETYTYDNYGNICTYKKPNGQTETYTYDTDYSLPLTVTLWQDANTKLTTNNTLSADGKSIASTETTSQKTGEAAVAVGKSTYSYDSAGRLIIQNDYKDAESYVTTTYDYDDTSALPVQVSVSGVKTANGTLAAGTPGYVAGTIVRRQNYNKRGWLTGQTDANGKTTAYAYDPVGRITKVTYPDGTIQSYSYDVKHSTVTYTDQAGFQWLCTYGQSGKLLSVKDLSNDQVLEERTYDHWDRLLKRTVYGQTTPDQITRYRYDTDGRVITQAALTSEGTVLYREDYVRWDGSGKMSKVISGDASMPEMEAITYQDNMGNVVKTGIFRNGGEELTTYAYDYLGNQTQSRTAYSASQNCAYTTSSTYNHAGQVLSTADADGNTVTYTYDWLGNQLTKRSPKDQNPNPNKTKYPTVYTYDALNRLVRVETPLAAGHSGWVDYIYDANGNVIQERTLTGSKDSSRYRNTYYTYDSMNRVTQVKGNAKQDFQSGTDRYQYTNYTYDTRGNIVTMFVGNGANWHTTQYTYDRYSRPLTQTNPLGQTECFTYDINGNLTKQVDRNGVTANYTYDAMGRLTRSQAGSDVMSFTYTSTGQRGSATYNGHTTTYTYNDAGDLIKEVTPVATKTMTYGVGGLCTAFVVNANNKTYLNNQYSYNKLGYLTKVDSGNVEGHYSYDSNGNVTNVTYGNNSTASYTYNKADMVTEVKNKYNKTELSNFKYTYGSDGNVLTRTEGWGRNATVNYTYDGLNRLTQESQTGDYTFANTYAYDDYSNRQSVTDNSGVSTNYTYDANNRLLSTTGGEVGTYTYDANGNLTQVTVGTGTTARTLSYTYDNFNRLKRISDNGTETVYTYDADGLRLSKTTDGVTERYVYDGEQLVLKLSVKPYSILSKTLTSTSLRWDVGYSPLTLGKLYYVEVNGVVYTDRATKEGEARPFAFIYDDEDEGVPEIPPGSELWPTVLSAGGVSIRITPYSSAENHHYVELSGPAGAQVAVYETDPGLDVTTTAYIRGLGLIASRTNGAATYYHYDAHGNVVQLTDTNGTQVKDYTYDAFGVEKSADPSDVNIFRYCGEQYDAETGNYYLRARYYTPGAGRFTQEDTHWNTRNMVHGDDPQKWNEYQSWLDEDDRDDPLGLHTYTYKPEVTAVAQAGNLYGYGLNNPVMYRDANGEIAMEFAISAAETFSSGELVTAFETFVVAGSLLVNSAQDEKLLSMYAGNSSDISEKLKTSAIEVMVPAISEAITAVKRYTPSEELFDTPETAPDKFIRLPNGQGDKDQDGHIWKKDKLHKDHWDITDRRGKKIKEVDYNGREIWPNGPKNKNK